MNKLFNGGMICVKLDEWVW